MSSLRDFAIRCYLYDRLLSEGGLDRGTFRAAVALYQRWSREGTDPAPLPADHVAAILLRIIADDPRLFWRDAAPGSAAPADCDARLRAEALSAAPCGPVAVVR